MARATSTSGPARRGKLGVFEDANEACAAAQEAFVQLQQKGVAARVKIVEIVKTMADANAESWGRIELEETKIGRLDHKIEKLEIIKLVPGVEWIRPDARSGDHGITLEEYTPFGVVGAVTPSTHSIPTLSGNIVNIVAAGNAVVFNAHPAAAKCAAIAVRAYNEAIYRETGIENIVTLIKKPDDGELRRDVQTRGRAVAARHRRPRRGEGRDADGQARDLRRPRQSAGLRG